jgi:hypothetical protein
MAKVDKDNKEDVLSEIFTDMMKCELEMGQNEANLLSAVQNAWWSYVHIIDREIGKDVDCDDDSSLASYCSINMPDKEFACYSQPFSSGSDRRKAILVPSPKDQNTNESPLWVLESSEDEDFYPILGRTHLLLITPGLNIARTPNNYTVFEPEDHEKHRFFGYSPDK